MNKKVPRPVSLKTQRHRGSRHPAARPIDWTPLSLHDNNEVHGLIQFSAPPPSPKQTGGHARSCSSATTSLLNGTA